MAENPNNRSVQASLVNDNDKFVFWQNGKAKYVTAGKLLDYFDNRIYNEYLSMFLTRANQMLETVKAESAQAAAQASAAQAAVEASAAQPAPPAVTPEVSAVDMSKAFQYRGVLGKGALSDHVLHGWYYVPETMLQQIPDLPGAPKNICYLQNFTAKKSTMQIFYEIFGKTWIRYITASGSVGPWHEADGSVFSHEDRQRVFVEAMNRKAKTIGMGSSVFTVPNGAGRTNHTCALDMLRCVVYAHTYGMINRTWGQRECKIYAGGREIELKNNIDADAMEGYEIIGGKTGSFGSPTYSGAFVCIAKHLDTGMVLGGAVLDCASKGGRIKAMKQLFDATMDALEHGNTNIQITHAGCAASCIVTENSIAVDPIIMKNELKVTTPSATAILLALIVACDTISNFRKKYTVLPEDIKNGAGKNLEPGDAVTIEDLMLDALLATSGSAVTALATYTAGLFDA